MKLREKIPPGSLEKSSRSMASRKRKLIFVAEEISSRLTPRISRSRRRFSPKAGIGGALFAPYVSSLIHHIFPHVIVSNALTGGPFVFPRVLPPDKRIEKPGSMV